MTGLIAYYLGRLTGTVILFLILRAVCIWFLENRRKNIYLVSKPKATLQEINNDFNQYFRKLRKRFYVILIIITILICLIIDFIQNFEYFLAGFHNAQL